MLFQSTPPYGGDVNTAEYGTAVPISIHAPIRGRLASFATVCGVELFQSTPPYGGDIFFLSHFRIWVNFNPRPHTGATCMCHLKKVFVWISIHAPIRGRPSASLFNHCLMSISIHAPIRGRPGIADLKYTVATISIHAPIRGRHCSPSRINSTSAFQSTPPYGGDCTGIRADRRQQNFNPRPHTGATFKHLTRRQPHVFQSTPPYGGDRFRIASCRWRDISIHAPIRGRPLVFFSGICPPGFQSTPPYGGDARFMRALFLFAEFQSTPPYGGDKDCYFIR